jgi:outer membrane protein assembly factor BamB
MMNRWRVLGLAIGVVLLVLSSGIVAHAGPSASGDWRQARFDSGRSGNNSAETTLSPFHARHLRRIWSFHTSAPVWGPPAVVGHRIFLASQSEHETGAVQALDVSTGRRIWSSHPGCPMGPLTLVQGVLVVGGVCTDDATGVPGLSALRPFNGQALWFNKGTAPTLAVQHRGLFGVVARDIDFAQGGFVVRYDPVTGQAIWAFGGHRVGHEFSGTAVVRGRVYVTGEDGTLYELGARSGKLHWSMDGVGTSAPVVVDGVAYVTDEQHLRAVDLSSRTVIWTARASGSAGIAVADGRVFVNGQTGLRALDATTGDLLWKQAHPGSYTDLVVADGVVYADSGTFGRSEVGVFAANSGEVLHDPLPGYGAIVSAGRLFVWGHRGIRAYSCPYCLG